MMAIILFVAYVGVCASILYYLAASVAAMRFALDAASPPAPLPDPAPAVAMLKPLAGVGPRMADNLATFAALDYPAPPLIVCGISDPADPAMAVATEFRAANPARVELVSGGTRPAGNRKIANVLAMMPKAAGADILVLSDADVAVERDHLRRTVAEMTSGEDVAMVTCPYRARPTGTLASRLEALFVNSDFAPQVLLSHAIEPMRHAFGATIAVKRAALVEIGGFEAVKDKLADDFFLGRLVADLNRKVKLSSAIVTVTCGERRLLDFWRHQLRWARTYRTVRPVSLATIVIHGPFWALLALVASGFSVLALLAFAVTIAARLAMAALMILRVLRLPELAGDLWLVPLKDLVMTGIWFASLLSNKVQWGSRHYRILPDGTALEIANRGEPAES